MVRTTTDQMNSDVYDGISKAVYKTEGFSHLEVEQAKESFLYNNYKVWIKENEISVKKN